MANSPEFVTHALELLSGVGPVDARAMFGGHGVYARGVMFGLLADDELFLKTDELSRPAFVDAGCRQWVYVTPSQRMEDTSWFRPPDDAHEDPEAMAAWAELGLEAALRARASKPPRRKSAGKRAPAKRTRPAERPPGAKRRAAAGRRANRSRRGARPR